MILKAGIASPNPLASQAAKQALEAGGNAIDAAIAGAICLTVVDPANNGVGGDAFASLVYDGVCYFVNGSGKSGSQIPLDQKSADMFGWEHVTVPGCVHLWKTLSERFGQLPWEKLFQDAITHAEQGFRLLPVVARSWQYAEKTYARFDVFGRYYLPEGKAPHAGDLFVNPDLAKSLRMISQEGSDVFYKGNIAEAICKDSDQYGGPLTLKDLSTHETQWTDSISVPINDSVIHAHIPNSGGVVVLLAMRILEALDIQSYDLHDPLFLHLQWEATKLAMDYGQQYITDRRMMTKKYTTFLDDDLIQSLASKISREKIIQDVRLESYGDTVAIVIADDSNNMVSLVQSNFYGFGSGVVIPDYGITLHNRGHCFSKNPKHPNAYAPKKYSYHTLMPLLVTDKNQQPQWIAGTTGGSMQPQLQIQVLTAWLYGKKSLAASIQQPRWFIGDDLSVYVEPNFDLNMMTSLRKLGHRIITEENPIVFGSMHAIEKKQDAYEPLCDPRKDGSPLFA